MWQVLALQAGGVLIGRRFTGALREMRQAQWMTPAELQARSEARLTRFLRHAVESVPFYRNIAQQKGLAVDAIRGVADLAELPVVTKATYRTGAPEDFYAQGVPAHRRLNRSTSGSSGEPLAFALDRQAMPIIFASHLFYDSWFDLRPFDRYVRIMSAPAPAAGLPPGTPSGFRLAQAVAAHLQKRYEARTQLRISVWEVDAARAEEIRRAIDAFRPTYVMGYASTLAELASTLSARGRRLTRPVRAVITIGETLSDIRRRAVDDYFGAPIINRYGLRELGSWSAQSCPVSPDRFHVNTELVVCEIVRRDGTLAAPGEIGRVVLTDLFNYARPFIRYDTGDLAALTSERCPCGRGFPILGQIEGRSTECLYTISGKMIAPIVLGHRLFVYHDNLSAVRQYQLVQTGPAQVRLLVVPGAGWSATIAERLRKDLVGLLGDDMRATVEAVADIPLEKSGKRPIIKLMPETHQSVAAVATGR